MDFLSQRKKILFWAKELHRYAYVSGPLGNVSCRVDENKFLLTVHNAYLGYLSDEEILLIDKDGKILQTSKFKPTSELALHLGAYKNEQINAVIHAHPLFTTAFYSKFEALDIFSYEARLYLSNVPALEQEGPIVTDIQPVLDAFNTSNIVVLKKHGVVSVGGSLKEAFSWVEMLEESCKVNLALKPSMPTPAPMSRAGVDIGEKYELFSKPHIDKIVSLVNQDKEVKEKGQRLDLTTKLAIKVEDDNRMYNFHFNNGRIDKVTNDEDAEFVVSGSLSCWRLVFERKLDPFAAATQRKLKLKGDMAKLSRWYAPFNRIFDLWKLAPAK